MISKQFSTELVVVGGGMAGLVSSVEAAERDVDVVLLEKGPRLGGSMAISGGFVWTYGSLGRVRDEVPDGDPALQQLVVEGIEEGYEWIESHGAKLSTGPFQAPSGAKLEQPVPGEYCRQIDPDQFVDRMEAALEESGGDVRRRTPMTELRSEGGAVTGVRAHDIERNEELSINAEYVVLATGGFQGSEELVQEHITADTENLWLRANPWSTGDGLLAAKEIGARASEGMDTFYGHNLLAPPAEFSPDEYVDVSQYYGPRAVLLDEQGRRFTDESASPFESTLTQDTVTETDGRAFIVIDEDIYSSEVTGGGSVSRRVDRARTDFGGNVDRTDSLAALGAVLDKWGVDGSQAVATLESYNQAIREGRADKLSPPRSRNRDAVDTPPFFVVEVRPGITFTMGGIQTNSELQVVRRAVSTSSLPTHPSEDSRQRTIPIHGLYAAGVDVGNVNHRGYIGGLAPALVTGLVAARNVVDDIE